MPFVISSDCISMNRILDAARGWRKFGLGGISSLPFADYAILLVSSHQDLQCALGRLTVRCEVVGMRISTSKSEAMVLDRTKVV